MNVLLAENQKQARKGGKYLERGFTHCWFSFFSSDLLTKTLAVMAINMKHCLIQFLVFIYTDFFYWHYS